MTLVQRPVSVTPEAWDRAPWYARLKYVQGLTRADRAPAPHPPRKSAAQIIAERVEEILAERPATLDQVAATLNRTPATVLRRLNTAGRHDLAAQLQADVRRTRSEAQTTCADSISGATP